MPWLVYILECGTGEFYTGCTKNLERRLSAHRRGAGSRFVRSRLPVRLVYREECGSRSSALKREAAIKKMSRRSKLRLMGLHGGSVFPVTPTARSV